MFHFVINDDKNIFETEGNKNFKFSKKTNLTLNFAQSCTLEGRLYIKKEENTRARPFDRLRNFS